MEIVDVAASPSSAAVDTPQADTPSALPSSSPALSVSPAAVEAAAAPKAGPGRPATRPHCLRCGKRVERCKCKDGVLLPGSVTRAVDEARKREAAPLEREEAEQILRMLCWALGIGESVIAAMATKLTWNEAEEVYSFTEEDISALLPPAHRVLAKYAAKFPSWIRDYHDEMMLAMALYGVERGKSVHAGELLERKRLASQAAAKQTNSRPTIVPAPAAGSFSESPGAASEASAK